MAIRLGDEAPNFTTESTAGTINFHEWLGDSWGVLFSHPADFTPVCTTELGAAANINDEFKKRGVKIMALSVDSVEDHKGWIADPERKVAELYDMIHPNALNNLTVRSVFVIGPDKTVKLTLTYPASTGRNFGEILRVIDSLQLTANHSVATPANWQDGDDCIIVPAVSDEDAKEKFPKGFTAIKPYLRVTPQPNK
jgi:alkyl hydroperoxide reductase subunit AhpC